MKITKTRQQDILKRQNHLNQIESQLKKEFVGIDYVIAELMQLIKPFYILPESLTKPIIINLVSLTGCGKTSLINRLVELLDLKDNYARIDVGNYATKANDKLGKDLHTFYKTYYPKQSIICFDEFQLGRTLDKEGDELERGSLRDIWDLLDSGVVNLTIDNSISRVLLNGYTQCLESKIQVKNGIIVNDEENYRTFLNKCNLPYGTDEEYVVCWQDFFDNKCELLDSDPRGKDEEFSEEMEDFRYYLSNPNLYAEKINSLQRLTGGFTQLPFVPESTYNFLYDSAPSFFDYQKDYKVFFNKIKELDSAKNIVDYLKKIIKIISTSMASINLSQSVIFTLANIDSAYGVSKELNPDIDPDTFFENSEKITAQSVKESLLKLYRPEQLSRMGNNFLIYKAFSRNDYYSLIDLNLIREKQKFKTHYNIDLEFTDNIRELIYKEGVVPTQGARPVLHTISTHITSYMPNILIDCFTLGNVSKIVWDYKDSIHDVKINNQEFNYPIKLSMDNLRQSDDSEEQAAVAVHEAGHVVAHIIYEKIIPKSVRSKTADSDSLGFMEVNYNKHLTKKSAINQIKICLAGTLAEELIFGDENRCFGAGSDITQANSLAQSLVMSGLTSNLMEISRDLYFGEAMYNTLDSNMDNILDNAREECLQMLKDNIDFLMELSIILSTQSYLGKDSIREIAEKYIDMSEIIEKEQYHKFKEKLKFGKK